MHVVCRLFFWLALAATSLALVAPTLLGGASWSEAQPVALLGLLVTLLLALASARVLPASVAVDPVAAATRRRSSGMAYGIILAVVLGPLSLIALNEAQQDVRSAEYDAGDARERAEMGYGSSWAVLDAAEDVERAEAGLLTSYVGLGAVALAILGFAIAASRRVPRPAFVQPMFQTSGPPYQAVVLAPYQEPYQQAYAQAAPQASWGPQRFG